MSLNWIDFVIAIILLMNGINGAKQGLVRTLFGLSATVIAVLISFKGTPFVASILVGFNLQGMAAYLIALVTLFVLVYYVVNDIGKHFHALVNNTSLKHIDLSGGIFLGLTKGIVYILFLLIPILGNVFSSPFLLQTFEESTLLTVGRPIIYYSEPIIQDIIYQGGEKWSEYWSQLEQVNVEAFGGANLDSGLSAGPDAASFLMDSTQIITNF